MDARAAERDGVIERLLDAVAEITLPPGEAGKAALTGRPVAGRTVDQHLAEPVGAEARAQLGRRVLVGRGVLHRGEAGARRRVEAVEKRQLGKQETEIGAEPRHGVAPPPIDTPTCCLPGEGRDPFVRR